MGFMDKAKEAAAKAQAGAQQAAAQGQAKLTAYQQSQGQGQGGGFGQDAGLEGAYATLGRAFFAEQRQGGDRDAVVAALAGVDRALAAPAPQSPPQPWQDPQPNGTPTSPPMTSPMSPAPNAPVQQSAPGAVQPGHFTLDDL